MTRDEIIAVGLERGRERWGKPLPPRAIELLRLCAAESENDSAGIRTAA